MNKIVLRRMMPLTARVSGLLFVLLMGISSAHALVEKDINKGNDARLSASEMDALRLAIQNCVSVGFLQDPGVDAVITVTFRLTPDGKIDGKPEVKSTGGESRLLNLWSRTMGRAILKCAPYSLPTDKYGAWANVKVIFHPSQMF